MKDPNELELVIKERLDEIKHIPPRDPKLAAHGHAQFLSQAVSASELSRPKGWMPIFKKERYAMNLILSTLVIAGLLFGGSATVSAAQDNLPNQPLYTVKLWTEDISLQFQNNAADKVNRLMELSQIRIQEMAGLVEADEPIPDQVMLRLKQHLQQALQLCVNMDDATLERTLLQIRDRLQDQEREMDQLQLHTQDQLLTQTRSMLQQQLQLVEGGLLNHEMFRNRVKYEYQYKQDGELTPHVQNGNGEQNGQLTPDSGNTNIVEPSGPNTNPGGSNTDSNEPNLDPGKSNADTSSNTNDSGSGSHNLGGSGSNNNSSNGNNSNDNGSGGGGKP